MGDNFKLSTSDDEEDLDALRLAALQSLKRKAQTSGETGPVNKLIPFSDQNFNPLKGKQRKGKFFRQTPRVARNGQFNNWTRNSNLISVPMISAEEESPKSPKTDAPKLILPQDRYCKNLKEDETTSNSPVSKFDRYNNSDGSESDSDEEAPRSRPESTSILKRSDSLEALMAELENEIQGETKSKLKKKKSTESSERVISAKENLKPDVVEVVKLPAVEATKPEIVDIPKPVVTEVKKPTNGYQKRKWQQGVKPRRQNYATPPPMEFQRPRPSDVIIPFVPPPIAQFSSYAPPMTYNSRYQPPPPIIYEPPRFTELPPVLPYERSLSPLVINTDAFSTTTLAPLSPRSAAFVLENRAIIEKRKRRSYSRSPSPRFRRSKSPKRSSISPPKRVRSLSPVRKVLPPKPAPKKPIHDRLGMKTNKPEEKVIEIVKEEKKLEDPVLEARRKKFENNEITVKEGVIRLRAKEENEQEKGESVDEEDLLFDEVDDTIEIDTKLDVLFSDEESNSDNEGRFKAKQEIGQKVAVLRFDKLINGSKSVAKPTENTNEKPRNRRKRYRSRSPALPKKSMSGSLAKRVEKTKPVAFPVDNKKIEIKIRNPAKYEGEGEEKVPVAGRKVEIAKKPEAEVSSAIAEVIDVNEGDLRAQLSRKRAERQKCPLPDVVPSRLLQTALQDAGFKKPKKSKTKEKDLIKDVKLPIHLRLGTANSSEVFPKKTRKHKNRGSQEQV